MLRGDAILVPVEWKRQCHKRFYYKCSLGAQTTYPVKSVGKRAPPIAPATIA